MKDKNPQKFASVKETLNAFNSIDNWALFWKRTVAYTHWILRNKYFVISQKGLDGKTAEDFAEEVIEKLLTGKRNWNIKLNPDLFLQVKSSIDSHINNFIKKSRPREFSISNENTKFVTADSYDKNELLDHSIETLKSLKASDEEILLFYCQIDGITKPIKIANELGISVQEVYNIQKRLNRKLPELQQKLRRYGI